MAHKAGQAQSDRWPDAALMSPPHGVPCPHEQLNMTSSWPDLAGVRMGVSMAGARSEPKNVIEWFSSPKYVNRSKQNSYAHASAPQPPPPSHPLLPGIGQYGGAVDATIRVHPGAPGTTVRPQPEPHDLRPGALARPYPRVLASRRAVPSASLASPRALPSGALASRRASATDPHQRVAGLACHPPGWS